MSAPTKPRNNVAVEQGHVMHEEIAWLASFGKNAEQIARELGIAVDTVHAHARGIRGGRPIHVAAEPDPEPPVPSHRLRKAR